jgi:hypothetical protein
MKMAKKWITEEEFLKMQNKQPNMKRVGLKSNEFKEGGKTVYTGDPYDKRIKAFQDSSFLHKQGRQYNKDVYDFKDDNLLYFTPNSFTYKGWTKEEMNKNIKEELKDNIVDEKNFTNGGWNSESIKEQKMFNNIAKKALSTNNMPVGSYSGEGYFPAFQEPIQPVIFKNDFKPAGTINIRSQEWEYGGSPEQDSGDQVNQLIQAYAQKIGMDPQELVSKLKGLQPEEQQQALQQMQQELQVEGQGMAVGGYIDEDYNQMFQQQQYLPQLPYGPKLNTEPSTNNWYQPGASTKATQAMGAIGNIMTPDMMNKMKGMMGSMNNASKSNMNMAKAMAEPGINLDSYSKFQGQYGDPSSDYWDKYMEQKETMAKFQPGINRIPKQNTGIGINMTNATSTYDFNDKVATKNSGMSGTSGIAGSGLQEAAKTGMSKKVSDPLGMAGDLVQGFGSNLAAMGDSSKPGVAGVQGAFKAMDMAKPFTKMLPPGVKQGVNAAIALIGGPLALVNAKIQKEQLDEAEAKNAHSDRMLQVMDSQLGEGVAFSEYGNNFGVKNLDQRITDEIFSDFDKYLLNINKKN